MAAKIYIQGAIMTEMKNHSDFPEIIQGGMGIGVSDWRLAKAVSKLGQVGVVSGTALDSVVARRFQLGDPGGNMRRALSHFPWPEMARRVLDAYFIPGGKAPDKPFKLVPRATVRMKQAVMEAMIVANFIEVFLAKEGHDGVVGVNYLEKVQLPTLPSILGAILAGVDVVLMGAGIPLAIPGILDRISRWEPVELKLHVDNNPGHVPFSHHFDPAAFCEGERFSLKRPKFLAVVSSDIVAKTLIRKASGEVDGFVVENHTAGGHNAPPRRTPKAGGGLPEYGAKDAPNIDRIRGLGRPFWLAGGYASPAKVKEALDAGANGVQVGTVFAYCTESGVVPEIRGAILERLVSGGVDIRTDFQASPTGYPFKLIDLNSALTSVSAAKGRRRVCDLGYLQQFVFDGSSGIVYRCPGEPVESYLGKGGEASDTEGKMCLCNGLLATIGLGQVRRDGREVPILTAGEDFSAVRAMVSTLGREYSAKDVIDHLLDRRDGRRPPLAAREAPCLSSHPCDRALKGDELLKVPA
jgi:nitronate monooxygenase